MASLVNRHKTIGGKKYNNYNIVECYRDKKEKKRKQRILHKFGNISDDIAIAIKNQIKGKKQIDIDDLVQEKATEYGCVNLIFEKARGLGLDKILGKRFTPTIIMIANRIIDPQSKLECAKRFEGTYMYDKHQQVTNKTLYGTLDYLDKNQKRIEDEIYSKRGSKPRFVMYDITSTYFCGDQCPLSAYGYSRDGKKGNKQIVIGLLVDKEGFPISIEVFKGNTADTSTMKDKIIELKTRFGLEEIVLVVDRGMNVEYNMRNAIEDDNNISLEKFKYITACKKSEIKDIIKKQYEPSLFENDTCIEVTEKDEGKRYFITYSEHRIESDKKHRDKSIEKTKTAFTRIQNSIKMGKTKTRDMALEKIGKRKDKRFVGDCFDYEIHEENGQITFRFSLNQEAIERHKKIDGLYVLQTNIMDNVALPKEEVVQIYRDKDVVEKAFEIIKSDLDIHPIYHYLESRVKGHVFLCYLAYIVKKELMKDWKEELKTSTFQQLLYELQKVKYLNQYVASRDKKTNAIINKKDMSKTIGHTDLTKKLYDMAGIGLR